MSAFAGLFRAIKAHDVMPTVNSFRMYLNRPQFAGGSKVSMDGAYGKK
jgi:hypothetical protein